MKRCLLVLSCLAMVAGVSTPSRADAPHDPTTLLVRTLHAAEGDAALAARLTAEIIVALSETAGLRVIGDAELKVMVGHAAERDALNCETDDACIARLAARAAAARYVSGRVGRLGDRIAVTLKLVDVERGRVVAAKAFDADALDAAVTACADAARGLLGGDDEPAPAAAIRPADRVAVFGLRAHGVRADLAENLAEMLSVELRRAGIPHVVSRRDVADMVGHEVQRHLLACDDDTACLLEIAGNLDVEQLVSGSVGRLEDTWFVHLNLLDMRRARVLTRASESFRGPASTLPHALRAATARLLGDGDRGDGELRLRTTVDHGEMVIGARPVIDVDGRAIVERLPAGRLGISLTADGFAPLFEDVYVEGGRSTAFVLDPTPLPVPWYREWWVWTATGAVVVGAVVAGLALSDLEPETGTVLIRSGR